MVHQHNLLKVIKPVDFHYFGKANKSHFDHRIFINIFSLQFGSYYFAKSQNSITVRIPLYPTLKANRDWSDIAEVQYMRTFFRQIKSRVMKNHLILRGSLYPVLDIAKFDCIFSLKLSLSLPTLQDLVSAEEI